MKYDYHKQYINSGNWKCSKSPIGGHYWILDSANNGACRYCGETKAFVPGSPYYYGPPKKK